MVMFYFISVFLRFQNPNIMTADSTQPPGPNKKWESLLQRSIRTLKYSPEPVSKRCVCIYTWF